MLSKVLNDYNMNPKAVGYKTATPENTDQGMVQTNGLFLNKLEGFVIGFYLASNNKMVQSYWIKARYYLLACLSNEEMLNK